MRQRVCGAVLALATVPALAACSEDAPSADPTPKPSASSQSPSPSPSPTPTPKPKPQPKSTTGATYKILNWSDHADDPALLAWKNALEAASGSLVRGKLLPGVRQNTNEAMFRLLHQNVSNGLAYGWHPRPVAKAVVASSKAEGPNRRVLTMCVWGPSAALYQKDGTPVPPPSLTAWERQRTGVNRVGGRWRVADYKAAGVCKGIPAPGKAGGS